MATPPFPPCGYSYEVLDEYKRVDPATLCCTMVCKNGIPCGRELKDHPFEVQLTAHLNTKGR